MSENTNILDKLDSFKDYARKYQEKKENAVAGEQVPGVRHPNKLGSNYRRL